MHSARSLDSRIDELQRELGLMEIAYERSKARLSGQDQEWEDRRKNLIRQMCELIGKFQIGDDATKAVAIVAQCSVMAAELRAPELWVTKYEENKRLLSAAITQRERDQELHARAAEAYENQPWRRASNL